MQTATTLMAADCQSTTLKSDHGNHHDQDPGQIRCEENGGLLTTSDHVFVHAAAAPPTVDTPLQNTDRPTQPVPASRT
jgi:hypothetical protein